jgi:BASS family bile acid:Na+ symporter
MMHVKRLLRNRNFILILSLILGLTLHQGAKFTERLVLPTLVFIMMLSMTSITGALFRSPRRWIKHIMTSLLINYIILGGAIIFLASLLRLEESQRTGFIVLASVPPAVAVLPFTNFLEGNFEFSLVGFTACYMGAFVITPLTLTTFLGLQPGFQEMLFMLLIELIILPLILSRILVTTKIASFIEPFKGTMINWGFFLIIYTIVGLNSGTFLNNPASIIPLAAIALSITFILGFIIKGIGKKFRVDSNTITSMILLGTSKNSGFAAGIALALFGVESTVPSTITTIFMLLYVIFLDFQKK